MTNNTIVVGIPGSGLTTTARELVAEHLDAGGHAVVVVRNHHHLREWDGLTATDDPAVVDTVAAHLSGRIAGDTLGLPAATPLLLVIDAAYLTPEQWTSVERVAGRGRRHGVSVIVTAHRRSAVPANVRDECELIELERRAA